MMEISKLERVLVIGCCGADKTTFSKKLNETLKTTLIHLETHYHKLNWEEPKKDD